MWERKLMEAAVQSNCYCKPSICWHFIIQLSFYAVDNSVLTLWLHSKKTHHKKCQDGSKNDHKLLSHWAVVSPGSTPTFYSDDQLGKVIQIHIRQNSWSLKTLTFSLNQNIMSDKKVLRELFVASRNLFSRNRSRTWSSLVKTHSARLQRGSTQQFIAVCIYESHFYWPYVNEM